MTRARNDDRPDRRRRIIIAVVVGLGSALYAAMCVLPAPHRLTDFDQVWYASRELLRGGSPYEAVGPGRAFEWQWPLYYTAPALLTAAPLTVLPAFVARIAFSGIAGVLLGYAIAPGLRVLWPMLLSAAYMISIARTQWSALLVAAFWLPWLGFVIAAKPNIGLSILAGQRPRALGVAVVSMVAITALSLVVRPGWPGEWLSAIRSSPHIVAHVLMPGGGLLALALLRYRRADARVLLALSIVPHTPSVYDLLPLFLLCRTLRESLVLSVLTHAVYWTWLAFAEAGDPTEFALLLGKYSVLIVFLPALVMVLRRPNQEEGLAFDGPSDVGAGHATLQAFVDRGLLAILLGSAALMLALPLQVRL